MSLFRTQGVTHERPCGAFLGVLLLLACKAAGADFVVTSTNANGAGSLVQAIVDANSSPGLDRIVFNLPTSTRTIYPAATLPAVTDPVVLDGTTQPGFSNQPIVELRGSLAGSGADGLRLQTVGSTVRGLVINNFDGNGISIVGGGLHQIERNYLGTTLSGSGRAGNVGVGIFLSGTASNRIGGIYATQRNVISANGLQGIYIAESGCYSNVIQGNYIGTSAGGSSALGNTNDGIIVYGARFNIIGGATPGSGNVISGNQRNGILLAESSARTNVIAGNLIGLSANGTQVLGNAIRGLDLERAPGNIVGGPGSAWRNIISGNDQDGVTIMASPGTVVMGNYIGTDITGLLSRPNGRAGISIHECAGNQIGSVLPGGGNLISGNGNEGVFITTNGLANRIEGNWIGVDSTGTNSLGNGNEGIAIAGGSSNLIGGAVSGAGNVISGNRSFGVVLQWAEARGNAVQGNLIGTDWQGRRAIKNTDTGIEVVDASASQIGGSIPAARNVISGNGGPGIKLYGSNAVANRVQGNLVGTDITGRVALGNAQGGIFITTAPGSVIGGGSGEGNVISGNENAGILIEKPAASGTVIQGNRIGSSREGDLALPNSQEGIYITGSHSNLVGGLTPGTGNLISGNATWGLSLTNSFYNVIQGNFIGTMPDGVTALPNGTTEAGFPGLELGLCRGNIIGGAEPGAGNHIAYARSPYSGIRLRHAASTNNLISGNALFANGGIDGGLGINLGSSGVNANDPCDADVVDASGYGGNLLQNFPELTEAVGGAALRIKGRLNSVSGRAYRLEFFSSPSCHGAGYGEGVTYLGSATLALTSCTNTFVVSLPVQVPAGHVITATATDPAQNTSEFSACRQVVNLPNLTIAPIASGQDRLTLSWIDTPQLPGLALSETDNLSEPVTWRPTTNVPVLINGSRRITVTTTNGNRFFRLAYP
jgi:hypothetical protein